MCERLLDNQIRHPILVYVKRRNSQSRFIGLKRQFMVLTIGNVEPDAKEGTALKLTGIQKNGTVGSLVVVKVCSGNPLTEEVARDLLSRSGF